MDTRSRHDVTLPHTFDPPVRCPAGAPIAETVFGSGVRCRVEHESILADTNPSSLVSFCCSKAGYRSCPTWQAEKRFIAAGRKGDLIESVRGREAI